MGILTFLTIVGYNIYWLKDGVNDFKKIYNGFYSIWLSIYNWLFVIYGFINLIHDIYFILYNN